MKRLVLALLLMVATSAPLAAKVPPEFRRTSVFAHPSLSLRHFVGSLGERSSWSLGVGFTSGLQISYFGVYVTVDTDFFLSSQAPPPFNSGFQTSGFGLGGRFAYPFGDTRVFADVGYRRIGFISNTLVIETGAALAYHAVEAAAGVRLVQLTPFYLELQARWSYVPNLDGNSMLGAILALGVRSIL